jgi:DNA-binding HxlR family transcriptional regulator
MDNADPARTPGRAARGNNELMRAVGGISQKMLTHTLRELERNGLIERCDYGETLPG